MAKVGWRICNLSFHLALRLVVKVANDPDKRHTNYWHSSGVADVTPKSFADSFGEQDWEEREKMVPEPIRSVRRNAGMYASNFNPFVVSYGLFGRHIQILMDYQDNSTVLGKLVWGRDAKGLSHTCWLDCYLYDTSLIKGIVREERSDVGPSVDEVEAIVTACNHKMEVGRKILNALENLQERTITTDTFLESLY